MAGKPFPCKRNNNNPYDGNNRKKSTRWIAHHLFRATKRKKNRDDQRDIREKGEKINREMLILRLSCSLFKIIVVTFGRFFDRVFF